MVGEQQHISIRLRTTRRMPLYLEPWGEEFHCAPGDTLQIVGRGPQSDVLEIEVGDDAITVYGWSGSVVSILRNGVELTGSGSVAP